MPRAPSRAHRKASPRGEAIPNSRKPSASWIGPDARVSVLENGLTVILKVHRAAPVVSVRMCCKTGSLYEQEYLGSGMSHLFEHLLHGAATSTRSEAECERTLNEIGGNTNAYTSVEQTVFFINTSKQNLGTAVELLADWITRPTFPQAAFDREWGVVQRELERDTDDADTQLHYMTMETLYPGHPARYPVIGYRSIVQTLTKEDIVGYHSRMYVPDNIVVCAAGDLDLDAALATVRKQFASFVRQRVPSIVLPPESPMTSPRYATKQMKVQAAIVRFAWPSVSLLHNDLYALDVLSFVLAEGDSSRLVRAIRDRGLAFSIDGDSWTPGWGKGVFAITLRLDPAKIDEARSALMEQLEAVRRDLVTPDELNQAKRQKVAEHIMATQTAEDVAAMAADDFLATGDIDFSSSYVTQIQKVTAEEVREAVRKYLVPQRLATLSILPEGFQPKMKEAPVAAGPEPARKVILPNGLRCLIRRDSTTPLVSIQAFSLGGVLFEDAKTNGLSQLAAQLALRGTEKTNRAGDRPFLRCPRRHHRRGVEQQHGVLHGGGSQAGLRGGIGGLRGRGVPSELPRPGAGNVASALAGPDRAGQRGLAIRTDGLLRQPYVQEQPVPVSRFGFGSGRGQGHPGGCGRVPPRSRQRPQHRSGCLRGYRRRPGRGASPDALRELALEPAADSGGTGTSPAWTSRPCSSSRSRRPVMWREFGSAGRV